jgi:monooxygenase
LTAAGEPIEHLDVLIVGAGLAGIGAAHRLQEAFPQRSYAIFEAREDLGGTWNFFRYPGVRCDSDMQTLSFRFRPWTMAKWIIDGASILDYIRQIARDDGSDEKVRFHHKITRAEWSSEEGRWTVEAERGDSGETVSVSCDHLWVCTGLFRFDEGYSPEFQGREDFKGEIVHPQDWPAELDYAGKRVVVIGSGATAVTLIPSLAREAAHVTMLQRSPTYIAALPTEDVMVTWLQRLLHDRLAYRIARWKNVWLQSLSVQFSRRRPEAFKKIMRLGTKRLLPAGYDIDKHFTPRYAPWDERVCLAPDGDFFEAIREGRSSIVTDTIERFTEGGIKLDSGEKLEADLIVTATGLNLLFLGGIELVVDGEAVRVSEKMAYKGLMLDGVPNFAFAWGYNIASWTLKIDLVLEYLCRMLAHMDAHGYRVSVPAAPDPGIERLPLLPLKSGYVMRSLDQLPSQGSEQPWKMPRNFLVDVRMHRHGPVDDGVMRFTGPALRGGGERAKIPA